jgi:hypothetical protein
VTRYQRDWQAAPHDPLAEAVVINAFMFVPERIHQYPEVADLLWDWKHKVLWRAMGRVAGPHSPEHYLRLVLDDLEAHEPKTWTDVWHSTMNAVEARVERGTWGSFAYWYARLEQFKEARQLVTQAQEVATRAWRGDVDGAKSVNRNVFRNAVPESRQASLADSILEF